MNDFLKTGLRAFITIAVLFVAQYFIPYYLIVVAAVVAGIFMLKTGEDRATSWGVLIGGILFGIFAYAMAQYFPVQG